MLTHVSISLLCLGKPAWRTLASARTARLIGVTSRGFYLQTGEEWIHFITQEKFRGPLTLNLYEPLPGAVDLHVGDPVLIEETRLLFSNNRLAITWVGAPIWEPPEIPSNALLPAERLAIIRRVQEREPSLAIQFSSIAKDNLAQALGSGSVQAAAGALANLMGRGSGLTPQGDDFIIGLLLAFNRWRSCFPIDLSVNAISQQVVQAARRLTTSLSTGLIACAADAQADERLVLALDGLVTGTPGVEACAELFSSWGSSSGWAAFQGMALAFGTTWEI